MAYSQFPKSPHSPRQPHPNFPWLSPNCSELPERCRSWMKLLFSCASALSWSVLDRKASVPVREAMAVASCLEKTGLRLAFRRHSPVPTLERTGSSPPPAQPEAHKKSG